MKTPVNIKAKRTTFTSYCKWSMGVVTYWDDVGL